MDIVLKFTIISVIIYVVYAYLNTQIRAVTKKKKKIVYLIVFDLFSNLFQ